MVRESMKCIPFQPKQGKLNYTSDHNTITVLVGLIKHAYTVYDKPVSHSYGMPHDKLQLQQNVHMLQKLCLGHMDIKLHLASTWYACHHQEQIIYVHVTCYGNTSLLYCSFPPKHQIQSQVTFGHVYVIKEWLTNNLDSQYLCQYFSCSSTVITMHACHNYMYTVYLMKLRQKTGTKYSLATNYQRIFYADHTVIL